MVQPRQLVERFYYELWNKADEDVARVILDEGFRFRGSLGPEKRGRDGFIAYLRFIHAALDGYTCTIEDLIQTQDRVAARMTFRGVHKGEFFGVQPTGREIAWAGAAFFTVRNGVIAELWVLGDIDSVKAQLGPGADAGFSG